MASSDVASLTGPVLKVSTRMVLFIAVTLAVILLIAAMDGDYTVLARNFLRNLLRHLF